MVATLALEASDESRGGSSPSMPTKFYALVAQLVEHLICNQGVVGSNPIGGSIFKRTFMTEEELRDSEHFAILKRAYKGQTRDDLILIILKYMLRIL